MARAQTTRRSGILNALAELFQRIDGGDGYKTDLTGSISTRMRFWDEVDNFPSLHMSAGTETREYYGGGQKFRFLTVTLRVYVNSEDPIEELEEVLEDIETLGPAVQARLLGFLDQQGSPPETRIIAVCNSQDPAHMPQETLRNDLFYRLAGLRITAPPLRERGDDILALFRQLSSQFSEEYGCEAPELSAQDTAQILQSPWPGNVRQLINVAERAILQSRRGGGSLSSLLMVDSEQVPAVVTTDGKPLKEYVDAFERMLIDNTMRRLKGSILAVMEELSLPRRTLNEKMAKYGLQRSDYL